MLLEIIRGNMFQVWSVLFLFNIFFQLNTRSSLAPRWQSSYLCKVSLYVHQDACIVTAGLSVPCYISSSLVFYLLGPRQFNCTGLIFLRWTASFTRHSIYEYININELEIERGDILALTRCSLGVAATSNLLLRPVKSLSRDTDGWLNTKNWMITASSGQLVNARVSPLSISNSLINIKHIYYDFCGNWEFTENSIKVDLIKQTIKRLALANRRFHVIRCWSISDAEHARAIYIKTIW